MNTLFILGIFMAMMVLIIVIEKILSLIAYIRKRIYTHMEQRKYLAPQTRYYIG